MLKICDPTINRPLEFLRKAWGLVCFHQNEKKETSFRYTKKVAKKSLKIYCPVSLLPICGEVFKRIIFNALFSIYLRTTLRIFALINYCSSLTKFINHLMMDSKHKVLHKGVIFQLLQRTISGNLLDIFPIFLSDR